MLKLPITRSISSTSEWEMFVKNPLVIFNVLRYNLHSYMGTETNERRNLHGRGGRRDEGRAVVTVEAGRPELTPQSLTDQVAFILDRNQAFNNSIEGDTKRPDSHYEYLRRFFKGFFEDRIKRSREIKSDRYQEEVVTKFQSNILSNRPIFVIGCIDGRDIAVHKGLPADTVATYRVAGGDPAGFGRNGKGVYELDVRSNFYQELKQEMQTSESKVHGVYWGGAHIGCAAGEGKQGSVGAASDFGLLLAMQDRVQMVNATKRAIVEDGDLKGRTAIFMPHVFNVNNGHTYWGLERPEALDAAKARGGATIEVLDQMAEEGIIISSKHLVQTNEQVQDIFKRHVMRLDWENEYTETGGQFTDNSILIKQELRQVMKDIVGKLYPRPKAPTGDLKTGTGKLQMDEYLRESNLYDQEMEMRAVGLMQSAYAGFLNNLPHDTATFDFSDKQLREWQEGEHYRYKKHIEEGIKASAGIYPPYNNEMFAVAVGEPRLPGNVKIANGIVRKDRASGDVTDPVLNDPVEFSHAPVPLVVKELAETISNPDWERYQQIDFSDLVDLNWNDWTIAEHMKYLSDKGVEVPDQVTRYLRSEGSPSEISDRKFKKFLKSFDIKLPPMVGALERLRKDMARLYEDTETRDLLVDNHILAIPAVGDDKREPRIVVSYIKLGISMSTTEFEEYVHI